MSRIKKVLVANRGEIALRVMRTCRERQIETVAVYSEADRTAPHVQFADESVFIGPPPSAESYLLINNLIDAAKQTGADAVHPGYGFLSENAAFANACIEAGLVFIGPDPESIRLMGDKTEARELMKKAGVPYPPGTESAITEIDEAKTIAESIGYPVLIKAAAGGGGKGMRIVYHQDELEKSIKAAQSEAKNAFGDERVFLEKYLEEPRHIEFQVFGDRHGNYLHMFERECSVQRRHQKVIEEAPSPIMIYKLREIMAAAALSVAKSCNYVGAGTVEFLVDKNMDFYFLEMNTRLQVEHPVTELITGLDLVSLQIDVAEGKKLPFKQKDIERKGHAIECRIYAENPAEQFLPDTGTLKRHRIPSGPGVRVDSGIEEGGEVTIHYDPMISKCCVHAATREGAIEKMIRALDEYDISGVKTTIPFCKFACNHTQFRKGVYDTHFIKNYFSASDLPGFTDENVSALISSLAASGKIEIDNKQSKKNKPADSTNHGGWWTKRKT